jgi:hypothetical protein
MDETKDETTRAPATLLRLSLAVVRDQVTEWSRNGRGSSLEGLATPNPLILGLLFRLVADRCDDLLFSRSRTLDVCGRLVLLGCH